MFKQHVLDDANGPLCQSVARLVVRGGVVDDNVSLLGPVLELCFEARSVVAFDFPRSAQQKEHLFFMCPMIDYAVIEFSLTTSRNPEYLLTTMRK
jgi:hypothetical protein